jgi:hypothetical protein
MGMKTNETYQDEAVLETINTLGAVSEERLVAELGMSLADVIGSVCRLSMSGKAEWCAGPELWVTA